MKKSFLCYYELHVDDRTFYVHQVVEAEDSDAAMMQLESQHGENYHLQAKGCVGELTLDMARQYLEGPGKQPPKRGSDEWMEQRRFKKDFGVGRERWTRKEDDKVILRQPFMNDAAWEKVKITEARKPPAMSQEEWDKVKDE